MTCHVERSNEENQTSLIRIIMKVYHLGEKKKKKSLSSININNCANQISLVLDAN